MPRNSAKPNHECHQKSSIANDPSETSVGRILLLHLDCATTEAVPEGVEVTDFTDERSG